MDILHAGGALIAAFVIFVVVMFALEFDII